MHWCGRLWIAWRGGNRDATRGRGARPGNGDLDGHEGRVARQADHQRQPGARGG